MELDVQQIQLLQDERRSYVDRITSYAHTGSERQLLEKTIAALDVKLLELLGVKVENG